MHKKSNFITGNIKEDGERPLFFDWLFGLLTFVVLNVVIVLQTENREKREKREKREIFLRIQRENVLQASDAR